MGSALILPHGVILKQKQRESGKEVDDNVKHSHCGQSGLVAGFSFSAPQSSILYIEFSLSLSLERLDLH